MRGEDTSPKKNLKRWKCSYRIFNAIPSSLSSAVPELRAFVLCKTSRVPKRHVPFLFKLTVLRQSGPVSRADFP